ncbi:MAG: hypothetical protein WCC14_00130 [Acidobacteriaceae bacterium]
MNPNQQLDPQALHAAMAMLPFLAIIFVIMIAIVLIPYWFIWKKAGFSPWLSLLMFLPLINLVMLYVLAFSEWKVVPVGQSGYQQTPYPPQYPRV